MSMSCMAGMSTGKATCHWLENHSNIHYRNAAHLSQSKEKSPTFLKRPFSKKKTRKKTNLAHLHPPFLAKNCTLFFFLAVSTTLTTQPNPLNPPNPTVPREPTSKADAPHGWLGSSRVRPDPRDWSEPLASKVVGPRCSKKKKNLEKMGTEVAPQAPQVWENGWFNGLLRDDLRDYWVIIKGLLRLLFYKASYCLLLFRWLWGGVARLECFGDINKWLQKSECLQIMKNFKNAVMRCLIHYKVQLSFEDPKTKINELSRQKKTNPSNPAVHLPSQPLLSTRFTPSTRWAEKL